MIHEYEGTFIKLVVVMDHTGNEPKARCTVIDLRTVRSIDAP